MKQITFILPTKDRPKAFESFIKRHQNIFKNLNYKILVVDGSSELIHKKIKKICKQNKNLILYKQKEKGFMNACFESIKKVNSVFCTFLYDDDLLSHESVKVFKKSAYGQFSMGYGIVENLDNKNFTQKDFKKISFEKYKNDNVILAYYGENKLGVPFMPVSPICFIYKTSFLKIWKNYVINFCNKSKLRKYFLLERNIGPDLIMYLLQILKNNNIYLAKPYIAKFNEHKSSMSLLLGKNKLQIGYWLAKKSILENNLVDDKKILDQIYNFLYVSGNYILFKNLILKLFGKENFYSDFAMEMKNLNTHKNANFSFIRCTNIIWNKIL